jgi:hypothetical protein
MIVMVFQFGIPQQAKTLCGETVDMLQIIVRALSLIGVALAVQERYISICGIR